MRIQRTKVREDRDEVQSCISNNLFHRIDDKLEVAIIRAPRRLKAQIKAVDDKRVFDRSRVIQGNGQAIAPNRRERIDAAGEERSRCGRWWTLERSRFRFYGGDATVVAVPAILVPIPVRQVSHEGVQVTFEPRTNRALHL